MLFFPFRRLTPTLIKSYATKKSTTTKEDNTVTDTLNLILDALKQQLQYFIRKIKKNRLKRKKNDLKKRSFLIVSLSNQTLYIKF